MGDEKCQVGENGSHSAAKKSHTIGEGLLLPTIIEVMRTVFHVPVSNFVIKFLLSSVKKEKNIFLRR